MIAPGVLALGAMLLIACEDRQMETLEKPANWTVECSQGDSYFGFNASWGEDGPRASNLDFSISNDTVGYAFYSTPVKFANKLDTIDEIVIRKNYVEISFSPAVYDHTMRLFDLDEECSRAFLKFLTGDEDFSERTIVPDEAFIARFEAIHRKTN